MLKKHNKHGPMKWFVGVLAAASLLTALPVAAPVYAAGDTGSSTTVQTSYVGFSAVSDIKVNNVSVKRYGHYNLSFNGNGNTGGSMQNYSDIEFDKPVSLENGFTRTGYTFTGWDTKADGSGSDYKDTIADATASTFGAGDGDSVMLYAQWKPNTYTILFKAGTTGTTGSMTPQKVTYDESAVLKNNCFSKEGYQLTGWKGSDGKTYENMEIIRNITAQDDAEITLTGQWTEAVDAGKTVISPVSHDHSKYWVSNHNDKYHWKECSVCGLIQGTDKYNIDEVTDTAWQKEHAHTLAKEWTMDPGNTTDHSDVCDWNNVHHYYCTDPDCGYEYDSDEGRKPHTLNLKKISEGGIWALNPAVHVAMCSVCGQWNALYDPECMAEVRAIVGNDLLDRDLANGNYDPKYNDRITEIIKKYQMHRDADGNVLGCSTGKSGVCAVCGSTISDESSGLYMSVHHEYSYPEVVFSGQYGNYWIDAGEIDSGEKIVVDACQGFCGKFTKDKRRSVAGTESYDISYTDTTVTVHMRYKLHTDLGYTKDMFTGTMHFGSTPPAGVKLLDSSTTISDDGWVDTKATVSRPKNVYSSTTLVPFSANVTNGPFGRETGWGASMVFYMDDEAPVLKSFEFEKNSGTSGFATGGTMKISGTEDYCQNVLIDVYDATGREIVTDANAHVNDDHTWAMTTSPEIEAPATGSKFRVIVKDQIGNQKEYSETISGVDDTAPELLNPLDSMKADNSWNSEPKGAGEWHKSIDWTAQIREAGSGEVQAALNQNGDSDFSRVDKNSTGDIYTKTFRFAGDKYDDSVFRIFMKDAAGNLSGADIKVGKIDNTQPHISPNGDPSGMNVTVTVDDKNDSLNAYGSGVKRIGWLDRSDKDKTIHWDYVQTSPQGSVTQTVMLPKAGKYYIFAEDAVGNRSDGYAITISSDNASNAKQTVFDYNESE